MRLRAPLRTWTPDLWRAVRRAFGRTRTRPAAWAPVLALGLALGAGSGRAQAASAQRDQPLRVVACSGDARLYRFETVAWPLEPGGSLPVDARLELGPGAVLRLRRDERLDLVLAGPARCAAYAVPSPDGPDAPPRLVLKLDQGALLVDGRFQFGQGEDLVLSLPDRELAFKPDQRFFVVASGGRSFFYVPRAEAGPAPSPGPGFPVSAAAGLVSAVPALIQAGMVVPVQAPAPTSARSAPLSPPPVPPVLLAELDRPVPVFVVARDYNQDLGLWPRPPVLGPLLAGRLARVPGLRVVDGSGDTRFSYHANSALRKGQDDFLRSLALAQGARWAVVGNCVTSSPPGEGGRWVRGQAEVRLLDAEDAGAPELVSEAAVTRVARAGRPLEQASRQAFEAASDAAARYLSWQIEDLLEGKPHAEALLRLEVRHADQASLEALRARLDALDSVQRFFRRRYAGGTADYDLMLRRPVADFDAQWAAAPAQDGWTFRTLPDPAPGTRVVRALRLP